MLSGAEDGGRVPTSAQREACDALWSEPFAHGVRQQVAQLFGRRVQGLSTHEYRIRCRPERPETRLHAGLPRQEMPRRHFPDRPICRLCRVCPEACRDGCDAGEVEVGRHQRIRQESAHRGRQAQRVVHDSVVERTMPRKVARGDQSTTCAIPYDEREVALEARDALLSPSRICGQDQSRRARVVAGFGRAECTTKVRRVIERRVGDDQPRSIRGAGERSVAERSLPLVPRDSECRGGAIVRFEEGGLVCTPRAHPREHAADRRRAEFGMRGEDRSHATHRRLTTRKSSTSVKLATCSGTSPRMTSPHRTQACA